MCTNSGGGSEHSNHSLRALGANELFQVKCHRAREGHSGYNWPSYCSIKALRHYEKVSDVQKKSACNILTGKSVNNYNSEIKRLRSDTGHCAGSDASKDESMESVGNPIGASNYEVVKSMGGLGNPLRHCSWEH